MGHSHGLILTWNSDLSRQTHTVVHPVPILSDKARKDHPWREFFPYAGAQIAGGCVGTLVAHGMFELPLLELAVKARTGPAQWFAEFVATFGLIVTILAVSRFKSEAIPVAVGLYITAAYWFTASTSFANPAVTIARALTNSFRGSRRPTCRCSLSHSSPARWRGSAS